MFDYTSNIRSKKTIPCTPDMFDIAINATKVSLICGEIADYREKKLRGEMSREDFETKKSELKRRLPAFLFHAHYSDGHRSNASAVPSGLSIYDLDHIDQPDGQPDGLPQPLRRRGDEATQLNAESSDDTNSSVYQGNSNSSPLGRSGEASPLGEVLRQHVLEHKTITDEETISRMKALGIVLAHISPSGEGLRLVFILPKSMDLKTGQKWLAKQLGDATFDEACKDLARCSFAVPKDYILYIDKDQLFADHGTSPDPWASPAPSEGGEMEITPQPPTQHTAATLSPAQHRAAATLPPTQPRAAVGAGLVPAPSVCKTESSFGSDSPFQGDGAGTRPAPTLARCNTDSQSTAAQCSTNFQGTSAQRNTDSQGTAAQCSTQGGEDRDTGHSLISPPSEGPGEASLRIFDETVHAANLTLDNLNALGTRHNSLVTILSMGLCRLMPKEQLKAVVAVRMPDFSREPDCRQLIDDWYQKYTDPTRPMSVKLQKIFTDSLHSKKQQTDDADIDIDPDDYSPQKEDKDAQKFTPPQNLSKMLPKGLKESIEDIPPSMQLAVLFYILPLLGAYADGVTVRYCDGREQQLGFISIIVGPQASGKSICKDVNDRWLKQMIESDMRNREIEEKWREQRRCRKANERAPEDPHVPILNVPPTSSMSNTLRRAKNAQGHTLYTCCEELDTVTKTQRRSGGYMVGSDYFRVTWDGGMFGQDYNSDNAESGLVHARHNFAYMGTLGALRRFLKGDNVENGLSSRIMIAEMPDNSFAPMPTFKTPSAKGDAAIDAAVTKLRTAHGFIDTPRLRKAIGNWVEEKRLHAMANADIVMDTYRKRSAVIGFRCGVIYRILEGKETKNCLRFATMIAEAVLQEQCKLFGSKLRNEFYQANVESAYYTENNTIFDSLPAVFTRDDLKAMKGQNVTNNALKMIIHRWKSSGWISKVGTNRWQKRRK